MAGLVVAGLLVISLLVVHVSLQWQPLPRTKPLDVDTGLPLPEIGQASTVFSLSALFGAYLGIYIVLGVAALAGLAAGTVGALLLIRRWIDVHRPASFEAYLSHVFGTNQANASAFVLTIGAVQCAFATSEMVIFRSFAGASFGLRDDHANLLVVSLAIIAYFYVLFGGYLAVFRTDVVQFLLVTVLMVFGLATTTLHAFVDGWQVPVTPRLGYWRASPLSSSPLLYLYHFLVSGVMALGFLIASPDAWKRVFLVSRSRRASGTRFALFLLIGVAPFLLLLPMAAVIPRIPDGTFDATAMWGRAASNEGLFVVVSLGLVASFLSAYNGALIIAVHLGLVNWRQVDQVENETPRFHWLMVFTLITIACLFVGMNSVGNPYMLGNLLLGPYAILAGIYLGGRGSVRSFPRGALPWVLSIGFFVWFMYFLPHEFTDLPTTHQVNTVPAASLLALLTAGVCRVLCHSWRNT